MDGSHALRFGRPILAMAALVAALAPGAALSSGCDRDVVARIRFAPGAVCWSYTGSATTFVGAFGAGQTVTAQMSGQASEFDPASNRVVTSWQPRSPDVAGPGGFSASASSNNILLFRTPGNGSYRISFSPCAMWGGQGQVQICTH